MKDLSIETVVKILDAAAEDWKMDMLLHIVDAGIDSVGDPYVNSVDVHGITWFMDLNGIYAESEEPNGNKLSD